MRFRWRFAVLAATLVLASNLTAPAAGQEDDSPTPTPAEDSGEGDPPPTPEPTPLPASEDEEDTPPPDIDIAPTPVPETEASEDPPVTDDTPAPTDEDTPPPETPSPVEEEDPDTEPPETPGPDTPAPEVSEVEEDLCACACLVRIMRASHPISETAAMLCVQQYRYRQVLYLYSCRRPCSPPASRRKYFGVGMISFSSQTHMFRQARYNK